MGAKTGMAGKILLVQVRIYPKKPCLVESKRRSNLIPRNTAERLLDRLVLENPATRDKPVSAGRCIAPQSEQYAAIAVPDDQIDRHQRRQPDYLDKSPRSRDVAIESISR
ncbi:MAG: hypothetical protein FD165_2202 [Gammaproteobacteria bacterium]|nr:MAG: hypothetical protein FD165_2202 [Gammaproteobacteria bacterium]TND03274.1 MAG: hypothetical protein FD120_1947 [Gammaproteobacteria bacterium]